MPTSTISRPSPGTLVFTHSSGIIGKAIRLGERLRWRSGDFYNHAGVLSDRWCSVHNSPFVIQALGSGVTDAGCLATIAPGGSYELVAPPAGINPSTILEFAKHQLGQEYGWLSVVSVIFRILLPRWFPWPTIRSRSTWICSALVGESVRFAGWYHEWADIYTVVPSELYAALKDMSLRQLQEIVKAR